MKQIMMVVLAALAAFGFRGQEETITVKGSDTMVILAQRWAESYMGKHPEVSVHQRDDRYLQLLAPDQEERA
jgi:phosphate transport system substrate-binding protein